MINAATNEKELQLKIEEYGDMLFKLSYIRLQNMQDAEDVVQEVFYQYLKHLQEFQNPEHEKAWLLKTTMNACRKVWRSAWKRHRAVLPVPEESGGSRNSGAWGIEEPMESAAGYDEGRESDPEEAAVRQEERFRLLDAVLSLPAKYRDVIHLFYYEDLSVKEIARLTNRRESTVTSQLTRGRELLKKALKGEYDFG